MKNLILISFLIFCFSCQEKNEANCDKRSREVDSLISLEKKLKKATVYRFKTILDKEQNNVSDTLLIKNYKALLGDDELFDLYIWDRIHTIKFNKNKLNVLEEYNGNYILRKTYNRNNAEVTSVKINNDSCFIYKDNHLLLSERITFFNSSNKLIYGRFRIKNYKVSLGVFAQHKVILLDNNGCSHCEQLQFDKTF